MMASVAVSAHATGALPHRLAGPPIASLVGPVFAVWLMGIGMISAAAAGRLWIGIALAVLTTVILAAMLRLAGLMFTVDLSATALAVYPSGGGRLAWVGGERS